MGRGVSRTHGDEGVNERAPRTGTAAPVLTTRRQVPDLPSRDAPPSRAAGPKGSDACEQPLSVATLEDDQKASRVGRGTRLSRRQRRGLWPVFEECRAQLRRPRLAHFDTFDQEIAAIVAHLKRIQAEAEPLNGCCLVVRTNELVDQYESALKAKGIETYHVHRTEAEDRRSPGVRVATMLRVKEPEFEHVIIASVRDGVVPLNGIELESDDPVVKREAEIHERALLYVAAMRAKREVMVTGWGKRSGFLG